jgi:hypothetical protein
MKQTAGPKKKQLIRRFRAIFEGEIRNVITRKRTFTPEKAAVSLVQCECDAYGKIFRSLRVHKYDFGIPREEEVDPFYRVSWEECYADDFARDDAVTWYKRNVVMAELTFTFDAAF